MIHLCYIHVYDYRSLKEVDISFDHRYSFELREGTLFIKKTSQLPKGFWGRGVYSLTAIMGINGAGKTTALRFMMDSQLMAQGIIVYEEDRKLLIYEPSCQRPQLKIDTDVDYAKTEIMNIETLYYSGHFEPYKDAQDGDSFERRGCYLATDQWLLIKDLQDYANKESLSLKRPLYSYLSAYHAQNHYRICELLTMEGLDKLMPDFHWPKYIIFGPNFSSNISIEERFAFIKTCNFPSEISISQDNEQINVGRLIYNNVLNLIYEGKGKQEELVNLMNEWQKTKKTGNVLDAFEKLINTYALSEENTKLLQSEIYILRKLLTFCHYSKDGDVFYLSTQDEKEQLRRLNTEIFNSQYYLTAKFYDVFYSHDLKSSSHLSSGEQGFLNLLSRLYYGITLLPNKRRKLNPRLILIDEAEIGFHPSWQRKYVDLILKFLRMMSVKPGTDFQVVITSHSPIILSDIPRCCVNYIRREKDGSTKNDEPETFCENVFNLYRRVFFLNDGLIGSFAEQKLRMLFEKARKGEADEDMMKEVDLIGDERIKEALVSEIGRYHYNMAKGYYQRKLEELNRRNKYEKDRSK